ncbi:MAG TPA: hemerythrin domain-containing protein, partial [Segetibacter sp.]|nr:hemerythrin domain-containing protein [Segetibacter sp.]
MCNPTPIKRSKYLVWLSRDHHDGLLIVWKTRQGIRNEISNSRISEYIVNAFSNELEPHFQEEENLLFNKLAKEDPLRLKAEEQHASIREKIKELKIYTEKTTPDLQVFADLLEEHIRFEERTLFPHIESELKEEELEIIGSRLDADHQKKK